MESPRTHACPDIQLHSETNKGLVVADNAEPDYRFTYKVTYTWCIESTGPLLPEQLTTECETGFEEASDMYFLDEAGCYTRTSLANIHAEETENTDWAQM